MVHEFAWVAGRSVALQISGRRTGNEGHFAHVARDDSGHRRVGAVAHHHVELRTAVEEDRGKTVAQLTQFNFDVGIGVLKENEPWGDFARTDPRVRGQTDHAGESVFVAPQIVEHFLIGGQKRLGFFIGALSRFGEFERTLVA